jgi:hypothetical protein
MSKQERVVRKKYMGLWSWGSNFDNRMMMIFPTKAVGYVIRRVMNRGSSSQGRSAKPRRMNSSGWLSLMSVIIFKLFQIY